MSWKSYQRCRTLTKEQEKASTKRLELLAKKVLSTISVIKRWYKEFRSYHKVHLRVDVTDVGLGNILDRFHSERLVHDDG